MNDNSEHSHLQFWLRELPYALVWILTVIGVGYTSVAKQTLVAYWEFSPSLSASCASSTVGVTPQTVMR
jgi:hypothetical protein